MCYRINNIWSLIRLLPLIQKKSLNALKVNENKRKREDQKDERNKDERNFDDDDEEKDEREKGSDDELRECHSYLKKISEFQIRMLASRVSFVYLHCQYTLIAIREGRREGANSAYWICFSGTG